jgi:hypothetical protein
MLETILSAAGQDVINILGFAVLAVILYKQNERLTEALIQRVEFIEQQVADLRVEVAQLVQQVNSSAVPRR